MAGRGLEIVYDFGKTSLAPQIFLSSCKYSWNVGPAWFEIDTRTYGDSVEDGLGRNYLEAHAIQVLDEPLQIFTSQARNGTSIPFTAKELAEAPVELWRSSVEAVKLF